LIQIRNGSGLNQVSGSLSGFGFGIGSGFRRAKMTHRSRKLRNFMFLSAEYSLLRADGFFIEA
jgi:hypothetical protein